MQPNDSQRLDALLTAFNQLLQNQDRIEQRLAFLEKQLAPQSEQQTMVSPEPVITTAPEPLPVVPPPDDVAPPIAQTPPQTATNLESKVGLTVVNRIGAITLVLGIAFFFKWAVDNNWIGPAGRVVLGLMAGFITLYIADFLWRKRQQVFAQGITATGIAIIYLSIYAAFDFYHLIPQSAAFLLMVAVTAMAAILALRYNSLAIAALGLLAGYITPLLLSTGEDHPWFLFAYLLLLNFAATEIGKRGKWPRLEILSFLATALIYGGWLLNRGTTPEKHLIATLAPLAFCAQRWRTQIPILFSFAQLLTALAMALIWQHDDQTFIPLALFIAASGLLFSRFRTYEPALFTSFAGFWGSYLIVLLDTKPVLAQLFGVSLGFVLFAAWSWRRLIVNRATPTSLALTVVALNGVSYYANSYYLLHTAHHIWLGPLAALVAAIYLAFGISLHRQADDHRPVLLSLGLSLTFLTLAIPIQFTGFTITIAWAIQGAALTWIGARLNSTRALLGALVIFALVAGRLLAYEAESLPDPQSYALLWNSRSLTFAVSAVAMLLAAWWSSKFFQPAALATYFAGNIVLLWGLCLEIFAWSARSVAPENRLSVETIAVSILFGVYAVILVSVGVGTRSIVNRLSGLGLIGIVILKLYLFDVWQLSRPYQISAFVILGILLLSTSFLYSHFRRLVESWWKDDQTSS
jgi:hypothetical protein